MSTYTPIVAAALAGGYALDIEFADGARRRIDVGPFLHANAGHEAVGPYLDPERFAEVVVVDGDIAWGDDWDILLSAETVRRWDGVPWIVGKET